MDAAVPTVCTTKALRRWKVADHTIRRTRKDSCESSDCRPACRGASRRGRTESSYDRRTIVERVRTRRRGVETRGFVATMYLLENPVLQRELLVNLRMKRAFVLLLVYQLVLAAVVFFAWPRQARLDANADQARSLVDMFFLGQYILASLMAPSFAAATITGEKERKTYEMLLASPLAAGRNLSRQAALVAGASGPVDRRLAADRDALLAAGRCFDLRSLGGLSGSDLVGDHVRHDQRGLQQLLSTHVGVVGCLVLADSCRWPCWPFWCGRASKGRANCDCC